MDPMLLAGLMSAAPGLLSKLFGKDPQKELRRQLMALSSPERVQALTNQFYQQGLGSPMFGQAQRTIATGGNVAAGNIARNLAQAGLGTSGTGAIMSGITPSLVGGQQAALRSSMYQGAQGQAQNALQRQIQALLGTSGPSQSTQLFGVGMEAFYPMLQTWLKSKFPGGGGGGGGGASLQDMLAAALGQGFGAGNISRHGGGLPTAQPIRTGW